MTTRYGYVCALLVAAIAIPAAAQGATLYASSGDGDGTRTETLFTVNTSTGGLTVLMAMDEHDGGETLSFYDGDLFRSSGFGTGEGDPPPFPGSLWQRIDPSVPEVVSTVDPISDFVDPYFEFTAAVHRGSGSFYLRDTDLSWYTINHDGSDLVRLYEHVSGGGPARYKGMAYRGNHLWGCVAQGDDLHIVSPADGSSLASVEMEVLDSISLGLENEVLVGCNGLAIHPDTGVMWIVFRMSGITMRYLGTVNLGSGNITAVGPMYVNSSEFESVAAIVFDQAGSTDTDNDGVTDVNDNCSEIDNPGDAACDTDQDGYGNACDCDQTNNGSCTAGDLNAFTLDANATPQGLRSDHDCNGSVTAGDLNLQNLLTQNNNPPVSGLSCAGTIPCP